MLDTCYTTECLGAGVVTDIEWTLVVVDVDTWIVVRVGEDHASSSMVERVDVECSVVDPSVWPGVLSYFAGWTMDGRESERPENGMSCFSDRYGPMYHRYPCNC